MIRNALVMALASTLIFGCAGGGTTNGGDDDDGAGGASGDDDDDGGKGGDDKGAGGAAGGSDGNNGGSGNDSGGSGGDAGGAMGGSAGGSGGMPAAMMGCMPDMTGIVRDFKGDHPDFNSDIEFPPRMWPDPRKGLAKDTLDADGKPVFALDGPYIDSIGTNNIAGPDSFAQWFRTIDGMNMPIEVTVPVGMDSTGAMKIGEESFLPINGKGFGDIDFPGQMVTDDDIANQLFTFEMIAEFEFQDNGMELMIMGSDDDGWAFINNKLAVDLSSQHGFDVGSANFSSMKDQLGLEKGKKYKVHFFMADRKLAGAGFMVTALNIKWTNCEKILPKDK